MAKNPTHCLHLLPNGGAKQSLGSTAKEAHGFFPTMRTFYCFERKIFKLLCYSSILSWRSAVFLLILFSLASRLATGLNNHFGFLPSLLHSPAHLGLQLAHIGYKLEIRYNTWILPFLLPQQLLLLPTHCWFHCAPGHPPDKSPAPSFQSFPRAGRNLPSSLWGTSKNSHSTHL